MSADITDPSILAEQVAYYRKRAGEYDEWWFRTGRYDHGDELNAAWHADAREVESALTSFLDQRKPRRALELACGTGLFTRWLAPRVGELLALDASPEVQTINRERVQAGNVRYEIADLFAWEPAERYDLVFMSFWLSHVPQARFASFWATLRDALAPGGAVYLIDSAHDPASAARNHAPPGADAGVVTRKLDDGSTWRVVKVFWTPESLGAALATIGWRAAVTQTPRFFIQGAAEPA